MKQILEERDVGVLISGTGLLLGMLETTTDDIRYWTSLIPSVLQIIKSIVFDPPHGSCIILVFS